MFRRLTAAAGSLLVVASMQAGVLVPSVHAVVEPIKVTIIVGPVGATTANYRSRGDTLAATAVAAGAVVTKVYSPNATWANVKTAVNGANVVVYLGHGNGFPNPYGSTLGPERVDGWGLNRVAGIDAADPTGDGDNWSTNLVYCGEAALEGKPLPAGSPQATYCAGGPITPAPGWVMIYSNACYTPGAGESESTTPTSESTAVSRVANYSRPALALNAGAYFASDIGSGSVLDTVLRNRDLPFGDIFARSSGFSQPALRAFSHATSPGDQVWIQKTANHGGLASYWYAFAGDPTQTPSGGFAALSADFISPYVVARSPAAGATNMSWTPTITVRFSEPVTGVSTLDTYLRDATTKVAIAGTVTYDPATLTATLRPLARLQPNWAYQVVVSGPIRDLTGNPLPYQFWSVRTPAAETFNPARTLILQTGVQVGYRFSSTGAVLTTKTVTLFSGSATLTTQRAIIPTQSGIWYYATSGIWAGYWFHEQTGVYLKQL